MPASHASDSVSEVVMIYEFVIVGNTMDEKPGGARC
jgi:hypothetical protein